MSILENIGESVASGIVSVALAVAGFFGYTPEPVYAPTDTEPEETLGADTQTFFGGQTYTLAGTGISSSASSFTLTSFTIPQNGKKIQDSEMSDIFYGTFEPGSRARQEFFSCTTVVQNSDGTATISGCSRGLSPVAPYTASTSLQFAHGGGTSVIFSNTPQFYDQFPAKGNDETITGDWTVPTPVSNTSIANKQYVLSVITGTSTISYDKHVISGTAGETMATGTIVYLRASDSRWYKADNDLPETYVDQTLGIAQGTGTAGGSISGGVLTYGLDSTQRSLTPGGFVFLSATAGATSTATTSQVLGKAISATTMFFDQNLIDSSVYVPTTFTSTTTFSGYVNGVASTTVRATTTTGVYIKPPMLRHIVVKVQGAGGNGATDGASGGGGGYAEKLISASALSSSTVVTVGTAGIGSGNTSFGSFVTAGNGGNASGNTPGAGGTASGGDLNIDGQSGVSTVDGGYGGNDGGSSVLGIGGQIGYNVSAVAVRNGVSGTGYGAGGSGGQPASDGSPSGGTGGNGTVGIVIITEYF